MVEYVEFPIDPPSKKQPADSFRKELEDLINRYSLENGSNTPDFILADYVRDAINTFDKAVMAREMWYGR